MNWLKKNSNLSMIVVGVVIFTAYILITDDNIETYEQIEIEHGDTLWVLADLYRGKMDKKQWIAIVKKVNYLHSDDIWAGQQLLVPIVAESRYLTFGASMTLASDHQ